MFKKKKTEESDTQPEVSISDPDASETEVSVSEEPAADTTDLSKIKDEELSSLKGQVNAQNRILMELGALESRKHQLLHAFAQVQGQQEITKKSLKENYGNVQVNLQDGTFKVVEEEEGTINTNSES